jgi:hypothetical protein
MVLPQSKTNSSILPFIKNFLIVIGAVYQWARIQSALLRGGEVKTSAKRREAADVDPGTTPQAALAKSKQTVEAVRGQVLAAFS